MVDRSVTRTDEALQAYASVWGPLQVISQELPADLERVTWADLAKQANAAFGQAKTDANPIAVSREMYEAAIDAGINPSMLHVIEPIKASE